MRADDFFDKRLPELFEQRSAKPTRESVIIFEIGGAHGGRWRVDLSPSRQHVEWDEHGPGDLLIRMSEPAFGPFLEGSLDVEKALNEGHLLLAGDPTLLRELTQMWRPPMSQVALRAKKEDAP